MKENLLLKAFHIQKYFSGILQKKNWQINSRLTLTKSASKSNTPSPPVKIAITGGIGSGKSLFANFIKEKGFPVIQADDLAKYLMQSDRVIKRKIIQSFGNDSYSGESINREYLAKTVFHDPEKTKILNKIVHPVVIRKIKELLHDAKTPLIFCEAALIFEAKMTPLFDYIVLISADEELRIKRVVERDLVSPEEVLQRMQNQMSEIEKNKRSHYIFLNNGTPEELNSKADLIISLLSPHNS